MSTTHQTASKPLYARCCIQGIVGRTDGEIVYCDCADGLNAEMNHLAYLLQEYAETIARVDAQPHPPKFLAQARQYAAAEYERCKARYDELERQFWGVRLDQLEFEPTHIPLFYDELPVLEAA